MSNPTEKDIAVLLSAGEGQELEFKRTTSSSVGREIVAFSNAEGGRIIFGVDDKNRAVGLDDVNRAASAIQSTARNCDPLVTIDMHHIKYDGKSLIVANVPSGDKKPYSCHDGYFLRVGATSQKMNRDELVLFVQKNAPIPFDRLICPDFTQNDFDDRAFRVFLEKSGINTGGLDSLDVLRNIGLVTTTDKTEPMYRNAAVLFFGKEPVRFIRQSVVTCVLFAGTTKVD
ncbi:MAG: putative DNA binding domain-containing protein, partial [Deltaproteobacteria bacterium]|nr:putative DNA binding domain-containing protein [Deltaproteobacteria bacterium]